MLILSEKLHDCAMLMQVCVPNVICFVFITADLSARGAAESVETLNKLRKTRDTLNDIVTENDQLKIEVGFHA